MNIHYSTKLGSFKALTVELVFGENSKHHSRTRVKCTRLVLFITTGGRLDGDVIWGLLLRTASFWQKRECPK